MPAKFRPVPGPHPDEPAFILEVCARLTPALIPAVGTTYADCDTALKPFVAEEWAAWKFGFWEELDPASPETRGESSTAAFHFYKAIPSTPQQLESIDVEIFGPTKAWGYIAALGDVLPARGDLWTIPNGGGNIGWEDGEEIAWEDGEVMAWDDAEFVYDAREEKLAEGAGIGRVVVQTLPVNSVSKDEDALDPETGITYQKRKTWTLSGTKPAASALDASGNFTLVAPIGFNFWLSTADKATTLPNNRIQAAPFQTTGKIPWPAVLESYEFTSVVAQSLDHFVRLLSYNLRDPYYGDVPVTVRRWWQATPYTFDVPTDMVASAIHVAGNLMSIAIPEALHGGFVYQEENFTAAPGPLSLTGAEHSIITWTFGATNQTDWPESIAKVDQQQSNGGFIIEERTYARPAHYNTSQHTVSKSAWHKQFGVWYAP